jgi:hypothetical protein
MVREHVRHADQVPQLNLHGYIVIARRASHDVVIGRHRA